MATQPVHLSEAQSSVLTFPKQHGLFLTIHLSPTISSRVCLGSVGLIKQLVENISPSAERNESNELLVAIGFGPRLLSAIQQPSEHARVQPFEYKSRKGPLGEMPVTHGDLFLHAKCDIHSKLFELAQAFLDSFPPGAVQTSEDVYGWRYKDGRDLSGFIDGTENPKTMQKRAAVAINPNTGGSYLLTQKWIHLYDVIKSTPEQTMESWIGRRKSDSEELTNKTITSHVARMIGGNAPDQKKLHRLVRHSMPWGTVSGDSGLFFLSYAATPEALNWMLDRMVGANTDGASDDVMRFSRCVTGAFFYVPSQTECDTLVKGLSSSTMKS